MTWDPRSLLWGDRVGSVEYLFNVPTIPAATFDPATLGGTPVAVLSNGNRTAYQGNARGTINIFGTTGHSRGPGAAPEAGYACEFNIDNLSSGMNVQLTGGGGTQFYFLSSGAYAINGTVSGTANISRAWATNSKVGIVAYLNNGAHGVDGVPNGYGAFFLNGTLIGFGTLAINTPCSFFAAMGLSTGGGQMTVTTDISAMTYGATYKAYRQTGILMLDADSWT